METLLIFLHSLGSIILVGAIGCVWGAVINGVIGMQYPKSMVDEAWPYIKRSYIFLGIMILCIIVGVCCLNA